MPHPHGKKAKAARARRTRSGADGDARQMSEREARLERQVEERRSEKRRQTWRRARRTALATVAAVVVVGAAWTGFRPDPELAGVDWPGDRGRGHVPEASYDTATPTSGSHDARAPGCRTYREPLEPSLAVHALEHGTVVLWYDAQMPMLADDLAAVAEASGSHVIVSASNDLDDPIVATAWNRRKAYRPGDPEIGAFVETYRMRGPERVDCDA